VSGEDRRMGNHEVRDVEGDPDWLRGAVRIWQEDDLTGARITTGHETIDMAWTRLFDHQFRGSILQSIHEAGDVGFKLWTHGRITGVAPDGCSIWLERHEAARPVWDALFGRTRIARVGPFKAEEEKLRRFTIEVFRAFGLKVSDDLLRTVESSTRVELENVTIVLRIPLSTMRMAEPLNESALVEDAPTSTDPAACYPGDSSLHRAHSALAALREDLRLSRAVRDALTAEERQQRAEIERLRHELADAGAEIAALKKEPPRAVAAKISIEFLRNAANTLDAGGAAGGDATMACLLRRCADELEAHRGSIRGPVQSPSKDH